MAIDLSHLVGHVLPVTRPPSMGVGSMDVTHGGDRVTILTRVSQRSVEVDLGFGEWREAALDQDGVPPTLTIPR